MENKKRRKRIGCLLWLAVLVTLLTACSTKKAAEETAGQDEMAASQMQSGTENGQAPGTAEASLAKTEEIDSYAYYQELNIPNDNNQTYYEVFLYSFCDSDGDGIGDINGLISKLDYINDGDPKTNTDLGFTGIWLMPIMQSPSYHKYDVADYYAIDPQYGTMDDFKRLIEECDKRGIDVILDLVLNHTSSEHPWFQSALKSLAILDCGQDTCTKEELCIRHNPYCSYYNFVQEIPQDGSRYYPAGDTGWYYEGDFVREMPDLNLDNPDLRKELEDVMAYWLDLGVHGFRLDAAMHYYLNQTDKNNEVLSWVNDFVKGKNPDNYLVAEVWTGFSEYSRYYESGIDSIFDFAFGTENGKIAKTLNYKGEEYSGKVFGNAMIAVQEEIQRINPSAIDAPFFTNHDTGRAAGILRQDESKIKMAGAMNLFMNGNVFVYYGEEIGMSGSGIDENKRVPMYWSITDLNDMTKGPKGMETVTHSFGTVEEQMQDPDSIYNFYKRAIRIRNENPEIARGTISYMNEIEDSDICAITKTYKGSAIIMLYNLSKTDTKTITVQKMEYEYTGIRGYLSADGTEVALDGEEVILPPYSIVILK
ncbi:MAG: alpha amylase [Lachnospiraceae bacterium]|nr:alpha amylase [Lachnospiraceae bacterium]